MDPTEVFEDTVTIDDALQFWISYADYDSSCIILPGLPQFLEKEYPSFANYLKRIFLADDIGYEFQDIGDRRRMPSYILFELGEFLNSQWKNSRAEMVKFIQMTKTYKPYPSFNTTCLGCRENILNQQGHMYEGGCLYSG